jgi:exodeoxyribonuclease V alpha subunit
VSTDATPRLTGDEELTGEVAAVVFANEASGFGVVELVDAANGDGFAAAPRAAGPLAGLVPGQSVRLVGRWTEHERYGRTFEAAWYEHARPLSTAGLVAFLASPRFPRVGPTLATRLVATFGLELTTVLDREPDRLVAVRGVSAEMAGAIGAAWRAAGALASVVARLAAVGIPSAVATAAHRRLGDDAVAVLEADPYALLDVRGASWDHAEALARAAGIDAADPRRLQAGAVEAQRVACRSEGHVALDTATLLAAVRRLLRCDAQGAQRAIALAEGAGGLTREAVEDAGEPWWYLPDDLEAERELAAHLVRLARAPSRVADVTAEEGYAPDPALTAEQRAAVDAALSRGVSVLTGGPGTGKTRTVLELIQACEARGLRVALCAPTGRAAKRLEEVTGRGAGTVHRLLEARGVPFAGFRFGVDEHKPLPHDVVVADEWSMADVRLARALARGVADGAHLVLVGDADQLPSVGAGAVLRDLLDARSRDTVAATRLTTVHRQAAASRIVTLAHELNGGAVRAAWARPGAPAARDGDVFVVPERPAAVAERVAVIVAERAPAYFDCTPADVQVLAPMYRGAAGVNALNAALKGALNPPGGRPLVCGYHEGDRVVSTRNDPDLDVANGDIGEVAATDRAGRMLEVAFGHGTVTYDAEKAIDLAPAWCLTVHKAQGGEWPVVVVVLAAEHRPLLGRELVYTALSRASRGLLLVGSPELLTVAAARSTGGARNRRSGLAVRMARLASPSPSPSTGEGLVSTLGGEQPGAEAAPSVLAAEQPRR